MALKIVRNDITKMKVDAIVNTANPAPTYSSGVDTAVYHAAGEEELLEQRKKIGWMKQGDVAITNGFKLPAKYIIHAVSPLYIDGKSGEEELLRSCYRKSLQLAYENKCESIAFPLISTGSFGYPKEDGMRIALDEINVFLMKYEMLVYLVVFDAAATRLGLNLYPDLQAYIDHNYVCDKREEEYGYRFFGTEIEGDIGYERYKLECEQLEESLKCPEEADLCCICEDSNPIISSDYIEEMNDDEYEKFLIQNDLAISERMKHISDTFQQYLLYLMKRKGLTASEVYTDVYMSKQLFSKIKNNVNYHPDKVTVMQLCIGLRLNMDETKDLLGKAGYALSPCNKRDVIFSYFIEKNIYDIREMDRILEEYGLAGFMKT